MFILLLYIFTVNFYNDFIKLKLFIWGKRFIFFSKFHYNSQHLFVYYFNMRSQFYTNLHNITVYFFYKIKINLK